MNELAKKLDAKYTNHTSLYNLLVKLTWEAKWDEVEEQVKISPNSTEGELIYNTEYSVRELVDAEKWDEVDEKIISLQREVLETLTGEFLDEIKKFLEKQ